MSFSQPWERPKPLHRTPVTPATPPVEDEDVAGGPAELRGPVVPTNRARRRARRDDLLVPNEVPLRPGPVAALGDGGWRATAETVDRLLGSDRARLRSALEARAEDRLRAAIPLARTLLADVTAILADVERRSAGPGATAGSAAPPVPPAGALRIAREFPWPELLQRYGRTNDAGCLAAANALRDALADLRADDLGAAHTMLARDLRRVDRALRDADRTDRPLSPARLRRLLAAVLRVVETVSIGLLAAAATAIERGTGVATAVFTAGVGLVVSASCEQTAKLLREHRRPPTPAARLATAHDELDLAVGDLRQLLADGDDPDLAEDLRTAALALAHHARRLAGTVAWPRSGAYAEAVDALVPALATGGAELDAAAEAVAAIRLPAGQARV